MESLAQEDHLGPPVYRVRGYLESKENRGRRGIQELESQVCPECQESQEPWECLGPKVRSDPKGRSGPWGSPDHKGLQGLTGFLVSGSQGGQGYQGNQVPKVREDPKGRQAPQAFRVPKGRRASGCRVCQA